MDRRRDLKFAGLHEVMPEVDRLLQGHRAVGDWSLAQVCRHLADSMAGAVEGVPFRFPWVVRKTVGPFLVGRILKSGRFPDGIKLPRAHSPRPGLDARAEAESLRASIGYFAGYVGPMAEHPLAGPVSRATWERFLTIHAAHHLGFLVPVEDSAA